MEIGNRPWGRYEVILEGSGYKVKRIKVEPGGRLTLQSHEHRSEHWVVVSGTAKITINETAQRCELENRHIFRLEVNTDLRTKQNNLWR